MIFFWLNESAVLSFTLYLYCQITVLPKSSVA
jgi:hypothetical protein